MLFQRRVDRAMKYSKEHAANQPVERDPHDVKEERQIKDEMERGDGCAMLFSALIVILPVAVIVLLVMCFIGAIPFIF